MYSYLRRLMPQLIYRSIPTLLSSPDKNDTQCSRRKGAGEEEEVDAEDNEDEETRKKTTLAEAQKHSIKLLANHLVVCTRINDMLE